METVGVIGVGKLGLCLALILEKAGYTVRGYDNNAMYRSILRNRELVSIEPGLTDMLASAKNFIVDDDLSNIVNLSTIFIVVNTPSREDGSYNHDAIDDVVSELIRLSSNKTDKLLVISCTTMPGYCDTIQNRLSKYGYSVCYNPEFIAQGDIIKGMMAPDMVLIGGDSEANEKLAKHYRNFLINDAPIHAMSRTEAEITKISLNCFLTTKIAFANSIGDIVNRVGGNPSNVLKAIGSDTRVGHKFLRWGHGFGGPCLPRDNRALCYFADSIGFKHRIGETTDYVNKLHIDEVIKYIVEQNKDGKPFYFDSIVYKKGTMLLEESQQLLLARKLVERGYKVIVHDIPEVLKLLSATPFQLIEKPISKADSSVFYVNI